jgi:mxaJ protein
LKVCADPNNLPYSNSRLEGFENRLADLVARDLRRPGVRYTWWAQRRGFFRSTLNAGACDVVIGVPHSLELVSTTRPYYRSSYMFVSRRDQDLNLKTLDDPVLHRLRVGVQLIGDDGSNLPPAHALSERGMVSNVVGFTVYGDYSKDSPPSEIIKAVADGRIDVALAWGPMAGYFAARQPMPLAVTPVAPAGSLPFAFDISMGVRKQDTRFRDELDQIVAAEQPSIDALLDSYHVPRLR